MYVKNYQFVKGSPSGGQRDPNAIAAQCTSRAIFFSKYINVGW